MQVDNNTFPIQHVCYAHMGRNTMELHLHGVPVPVNVPVQQQAAATELLLASGGFIRVEGYLINRYRISMVSSQGGTARVFFAADVKPLFLHALIAQPLIDDIGRCEDPAGYDAYQDSDEAPEEPEMPAMLAEIAGQVSEELNPLKTTISPLVKELLTNPPETQEVMELPAPEEKKTRKKKAGA